MRVQANGVSLHYKLDGTAGRPVVTLSHSLATRLEMWEPQVAALAEHFQILRYDMRGHGASEVPAGPYSMEMLSDDVIGLWNALGIRRSHFVGLSIGGMIGQTLALNHSDRLAGLVLCSTTSGVPAHGRPMWDDRIRQVEESGMEPQVDGMLQRWLLEEFRRSQPDVVGQIAGMIRATPVPGFIGCSRAIQSFDVTERLGAITAPTLLMPGEKDPGTLPAFSETIHRLVPGSRLAVVPDSAHLSNIEQPEFVAQTILDFLLMLETSEKPEKVIKMT
jgi:3-oxoadipate enol-lactonase